MLILIFGRNIYIGINKYLSKEVCELPLVDSNEISQGDEERLEREPGKRRIKPSQNFLDFEDLGESSDDSDFRIEDHENGSDDDSDVDSEDKSKDSSSNSNSDEDNDEDDDDEDEDEFEKNLTESQLSSLSVGDVLSQAEKAEGKRDFTKILICCVCLGDFSSDVNEIIECDCCGVTVHEGCYGVPDSASVSSAESSCSTEPWFCEACRAGVESPVCELCPNTGGIFKETDVGKWVHLVCALYVPGVAFGEVDKLSNVTLFELPFSRWASKLCQHCQDSRLMRTGVTIQCDAGMCRTHFHVTCGQREGLLTEANAEEVDQADPFYAHCKLHCDKTLARKRKRNWLALQFRANQMQKQKRENIVQNWERIQRKLSKYRSTYMNMKVNRPQPWVPSQKRPRLLTTSASACRALWKKSELMGIDTTSLEAMDIHIATLMDIPKKWHIQPAFSIEFVGYFLDRNGRIDSLKKQLASFMETNNKLLKEQEKLQETYNQTVKKNSEEISKCTETKDILKVYYNVISNVCPNKKLPNLDELSKPCEPVTSVPLAPNSVNLITPAALKAGIGYPLGLLKQGIINKKIVPAASESAVLMNSKCGICKQSNDQHLLAKCDTCHLFYHLGCLNPPLTRMPKKTKSMGWQCSECDKDSSSSEAENVDTEAPRKLRHPIKDSEKNDKVDDLSENSQHFNEILNSEGVLGISEKENNITPANGDVENTNHASKKRRRDKHCDRYSPETIHSSDPARVRKRKRKHKSSDSEEPRHHIKIFIKSIPNPNKEGNATSPQLFVASANSSHSSLQSSPVAPLPIPVVPPPSRQATSRQSKAKGTERMNDCDTCKGSGDFTNMVSCDECKRCFHFGCLDPPVKKSPKVRGYSWHCANCDPTESDSD